MRAIDLAGRRFGKLTAINVAVTGRHRKWLCICDCGREAIIQTNHLTSGNSTACGRCRGPNQNARKHGFAPQGTKSPTYRSWLSMKKRCTNPRSDNFSKYGARGITYDSRWESFEMFLADMGERPTGTTLDRIDGSKGYSKDNCRWATPAVQTMNRSITRVFEYQGERRTAMEWSAIYGLTYAATYNRLTRGKSLGNIQDG